MWDQPRVGCGKVLGLGWGGSWGTYWELMGESAPPICWCRSLRALLLRLQCSLHIHASYSISQKLNVPMAPLSEPNAVGIVIAHGTSGDGRRASVRVCVSSSSSSSRCPSSQGAWGGPSR